MTGAKLYTTPAWRRLARRRLELARVHDEPCGLCGRPIDYRLPGTHRLGPTVDHTTPMVLGGAQLPDLDELRPAHRDCNTRHGAKLGRAIQLRAQPARKIPTRLRAVETENDHDDNGERSANFSVSHRSPLTAEVCVPGGLGQGPRFLSPPHPDAVDTLGPAWSAWAESTLLLRGAPVVLRSWQRLVLDRLLEVDSAGRLCWREAVVSTPRQVGKSVLIAVYSLARAALLSPPQGVLLVSAGLRQALRLHQLWWPWAAEADLHLTRQMDAATISWPSGSWWRLSSANAVWGATADAAVVDEAWDVVPGVAEGALQPTLVSRPSSQLILASTANTEATPLVLSWRRRALAGSARTMIAEWSADPDDDPDDPQTWQAASPVWDPDRAELVEAQRHAAGWAQNWLNQWPSTRHGSGWPAGWDGCGRLPGAPPPGLLGGLETSLDRSRVGVAVAARAPDGSVHCWARQLGSLPAALALLRSWAPATVLAGLSVAGDVLGPWAVHPVGAKETVRASPALADLVSRHQLAHDHDAGVAAEVAAARTTNSEAGRVLSASRSAGPVPALKAAAWTCWGLTEPRFAPVKPQIW